MPEPRVLARYDRTKHSSASFREALNRVPDERKLAILGMYRIGLQAIEETYIAKLEAGDLLSAQGIDAIRLLARTQIREIEEQL